MCPLPIRLMPLTSTFRKPARCAARVMGQCLQSHGNPWSMSCCVTSILIRGKLRSSVMQFGRIRTSGVLSSPNVATLRLPVAQCPQSPLAGIPSKEIRKTFFQKRSRQSLTVLTLQDCLRLIAVNVCPPAKPRIIRALRASSARPL